MSASHSIPPDSTQANRASAVWLVLVVGELALALTAFWLLLGCRFSPETYRTGPMDRGTVELSWFSLVVISAIIMVVWLRKSFEACRNIARSCLPFALVSCWMVLQSVAGGAIRCYDVILFAAACGWSVLLAQ